MSERETSFDRFFDSMEALADALSERLQAQVTIEDEHHNVIGYSSHQFESDPARISTIIGKRVPDAVIAGLRRKGVMQALEQGDRPLRIPAVPEVGLGPRLAVCVRHQKEVLGYIWVVDGGNLPQDEAEATLAQAANTVSRYRLKQRGWKAKQDKSREDFLWKLLTSHYVSEEDVRRDARSLGLLLPSVYYIAVFEFPGTADGTQLQKLRRLFESEGQAELILATSEHNRLIALFGFQARLEGGGERAAALMRMAEALGGPGRPAVSAACSSAGSAFAASASLYAEADAVLELRRLLPFHAGRLALYEEAGFLAFVPGIMEQKRVRRSASPLLQPLLDHDREHRSDLVKTLAVYLTLDGNLKESAAFLHVHSNTLLYRLGRIAELSGRSLKDTHYRMSVYLDLLTEERERVNDWLGVG